MNKHDAQKGRDHGTVPLCSQGEVALQHGVEKGVGSVDLLLFCSFSSSASSLRGRQGTVLQCTASDNRLSKNRLNFVQIYTINEKNEKIQLKKNCLWCQFNDASTGSNLLTSWDSLLVSVRAASS